MPENKNIGKFFYKLKPYLYGVLRGFITFFCFLYVPKFFYL